MRVTLFNHECSGCKNAAYLKQARMCHLFSPVRQRINRPFASASGAVVIEDARTILANAVINAARQD